MTSPLTYLKYHLSKVRNRRQIEVEISVKSRSKPTSNPDFRRRPRFSSKSEIFAQIRNFDEISMDFDPRAKVFFPNLGGLGGGAPQLKTNELWSVAGGSGGWSPPFKNERTNELTIEDFDCTHVFGGAVR